jgi:hypothetical protein
MGFNSGFKGLKNTKNSCVLTETKTKYLKLYFLITQERDVSTSFVLLQFNFPLA